jgi:hypothetical protein
VSSRLGLPIVPSSLALVKSYETEVSEQLKALLHELPRIEEPFRFFKYAFYAYESFLDSIANILSVENPPEDLFDRMEWAISSYLFGSKAAVDHLRSHYVLSGIGTDPINSRVDAGRKLSKEFWFGEALRHYVTHTATPVSERSRSYNLSKRHIRIMFHKADAEKDAEKGKNHLWKDLLPLLPKQIDLSEYLKLHFAVTMNFLGAYFFSTDVLPTLKNLLQLLDLPRNPDASSSVLCLLENPVPEDLTNPTHDLGLVADCSGLLRNFEFLLSIFLLPKTTLKFP